MNFPNFLTFLRLLISPLFMALYLYPQFFHLNDVSLPYALLLLFIISETTDAFDGFFARRLGQVSELGKILDPMADSISHTAAFLCFTMGPVAIPIWIVFLCLYRDSVVSTLRIICAMKGFTLSARLSGKLKAVFQAFTIFVILILMIVHAQGGISEKVLQTWAFAVSFAMALFTVLSGFEYMIANRSYIKKTL